jgi:DNA ligase-1
MKDFAALYTALDETTATNDKIAALVGYFRSASPGDAAWAVHFLSGRRPKRLIRAADLRAWAGEAAGIPEWLFDESYHAVGDLAETIALLLPEGEGANDRPLAWWVEERLLALRDLDPGEQRAALVRAWRELSGRERYVWNKLITGAFRVGASQRLVVRALAEVSGVADEVIAHRLMGTWEPGPGFFERLVARDTRDGGTMHGSCLPFICIVSGCSVSRFTVCCGFDMDGVGLITTSNTTGMPFVMPPSMPPLLFVRVVILPSFII